MKSIEEIIEEYKVIIDELDADIKSKVVINNKIIKELSDKYDISERHIDIIGCSGVIIILIAAICDFNTALETLDIVAYNTCAATIGVSGALACIIPLLKTKSRKYQEKFRDYADYLRYLEGKKILVLDLKRDINYIETKEVSNLEERTEIIKGICDQVIEEMAEYEPVLEERGPVLKLTPSK